MMALSSRDKNGRSQWRSHHELKQHSRDARKAKPSGNKAGIVLLISKGAHKALLTAYAAKIVGNF